MGFHCIEKQLDDLWVNGLAEVLDEYDEQLSTDDSIGMEGSDVHKLLKESSDASNLPLLFDQVR